MTAENIPNYRLYGEDGDQADVDFVHCESISQRSIIHDWNIRPHRHDTLYQFFHMREGGGVFLLEGTPLELSVPCLILIPPMVVHGFEFQRDIEGTVITINEKDMDRILAAAPALLSDLSAPKIVHGKAGIDFEEIEDLFSRFSEEYFGRDPGRLCALQSWLGLLFVQLGRSIATETRRRYSVADKRLGQLRRYRGLIETRFRDHRPVAGYAADLGMTPTHLNRICRNLVGKSALAVVHDRLLLEAKRDLIYTSMSIKEISNALGFSDPGYFTRFFTRNAGLSPSEFRSGKREEVARPGKGNAIPPPRAEAPERGMNLFN